jgi:nitric oxide reductase NorQ protein
LRIGITSSFYEGTHVNAIAYFYISVKNLSKELWIVNPYCHSATTKVETKQTQRLRPFNMPSSDQDHPQRQSPKEQIVTNAQGSGVRLNISISKSKLAERPDLVKKYEVRDYDLSLRQVFPEKYRALIPHNTPEYVEHGERYIERLTRALYHFKQCALIGPSGTGKTHVVYLLSELQELPLWEINCGLQTSVYDLFGRYVGLGKENWIDGQIVSWCRVGGILYLDEANMMKQDVATRLNPVLDARGHLVLTEKDNEIVPRSPASYLVVSMNPFSSEFAGTKPLNAAFRRRMSVWIDFDYLSIGNRISDEEISLIEKRAKVDRDVAEGITKIGAELRRQYKANEIPYGPSIGDLINWGILVSDGVEPSVAAEETIVAMTSDNAEVQDIVRRVVQMVFGSVPRGPNVRADSESPTQHSIEPEVQISARKKLSYTQSEAVVREDAPPAPEPEVSQKPKRRTPFKTSFGLRSDNKDEFDVVE